MSVLSTYSFVVVLVCFPVWLKFAQESDQNSAHAVSTASEQLVGNWHVDADLTNEANRETREKMTPETIAMLNSMKMKLADDGNFEQSIGAAHKIVGQWKFAADEPAGKQPSLLASGLLTLIPENLDNHANMEFQVAFTESNLIQATPPLGTGTVFFRKSKDAAAETSQQKQPNDQKRDRAAEIFAKVPGCLGARSLEHDDMQISFVWFEDRKAIVDWCKSAKHLATAQKMMEMADPELKMREPLAAAPDENGPFLVIMTMKPKKNMDGSFPLEQLSMELYKPVNGGMFIGDRFAPGKLKVTGCREITTK